MIFLYPLNGQVLEIGYGTYRIANIRVIAKPDRFKRFIRPEDSRIDPELMGSGL
jgi:hypothetical protein